MTIMAYASLFAEINCVSTAWYFCSYVRVWFCRRSKTRSSEFDVCTCTYSYQRWKWSHLRDPWPMAIATILSDKWD